MSINLLQISAKYLSLIAMTFLSLLGVDNYKENLLNINNKIIENDGKIVQAIEYDIKYIYNSKLPSNVEKVIQKGEYGISYENKIIDDAKEEIIEKGTGAYGIFKGRLVGYGPDCPGCSKQGNVACKTEDKRVFSLINDGIYYEDSEFGSVRILATDLNNFPCGTIIKVEKEDGREFMAVVLDRIGTKSDIPLFDLAYSSQNDKTVFNADNLTGRNVTFNVQRWGW